MWTRRTLTTILLTLLASCAAGAQILPDRTVVLDPLGRPGSGGGFTWLGATRLVGEFSRYSNGSGDRHRWSARTGGYVEIARWDSTTSLAMIGTMEVIADPHSDIGFNPRAIFWEEGVMASRRLADGAALQLGFVHRCKHDIDNVEAAVIRGIVEQRTLIYSSAMARLLLRPRAVVTSGLEISAGGALRNDLFLYLTDDRFPAPFPGADPGVKLLANATSLTARVGLRPAGSTVELHLAGSILASVFRSDPARGVSAKVIGSVPFAEAGLDLSNPAGATLTIFARGEWQPDAAIGPEPERARLFLMGLRLSGSGDMW